MIKIVNVTPHPLNFRDVDGNEFEVPLSGVVLNATPIEEVVGRHASGADLIRVRFEGFPEALDALEFLERKNPGAVIVGSMIAARAFPGRVFGLIATPGYERCPAGEKRMNPKRFSVF